jgi:hypothetical protein
LNTLGRVRWAIRSERNASVTSLAEYDLDPGYVYDLGAAEATFIAGWSDGHETENDNEPALSGGPLNNALSIVIRYTYGGHSVLLTGDTVGRRDNAPASACQYAEARMVANAGNATIESEVLVGQHHGADNPPRAASSTLSIRAMWFSLQEATLRTDIHGARPPHAFLQQASKKMPSSALIAATMKAARSCQPRASASSTGS